MFSWRNFGYLKIKNISNSDYVYLIINYNNNLFNFEIGVNIHIIETCYKKLNRNLKIQVSISSSIIFLIGEVSNLNKIDNTPLYKSKLKYNKENLFSSNFYCFCIKSLTYLHIFF